VSHLDQDRVPEPEHADDRERVAQLLGRRPQGSYEIVVRRNDGWPVVVRNSPLLDSGRPMPTRYWLIDRELNKEIGRLEAEGGVNRAEAAVDPETLAATHAAYAAERNTELQRLAAEHGQHPGPLPSGGVGGTRIGVKCLHAHYAHFLAGGDDPVGQWVDDRLRERGRAFDPTRPARIHPGLAEQGTQP
jgi:hypothetical protein